MLGRLLAHSLAPNEPPSLAERSLLQSSCPTKELVLLALEAFYSSLGKSVIFISNVINYKNNAVNYMIAEPLHSTL
jgi:hypothetical protein